MGNALAVEPPAPLAVPGLSKPFATVFRLRGDIVAVPAGSTAERKLRLGDTVQVGETIKAAAAGEAVLKTEDAGLVAVRPGTEFVAERFAAEGRSSDNMTVRILTGSLRMITGWIGQLNRAEYRVVTPTATIGIRGTDHEPYVLSAELAKGTANREGTYDKVNRGGTMLTALNTTLNIDPGQVGFARAAPQRRERVLMTLLLPVLLDKVPDFYVPGEFDAELDSLSQTAEQESRKQLEQRRKMPAVPVPVPVPAPAPAAAAAPPAAAPSVAAPSTPPIPVAPASVAPPAGEHLVPPPGCVPTDIAKTWLDQLDAAVAGRNVATILGKFAPDAAIRAVVRSKDGNTTSVDFDRDEFVKSTLDAMRGLTEFKQRRAWMVAHLASPNACQLIRIKSVVIEQGRQAGKPYRFESMEDYILELRNGQWQAIKAEAAQR